MKRATKILATVAGVAVVGGATVLGVTGGSADPTQHTTTNSNPQQVESKCGLQGTPGNPTELPAQWQEVHGYYLPVSKSDGPGVRNEGGAWSCYARTPAGAVLAGYIIAMGVDGLAEDWQTVVREQTVPGPAQEAKLQSVPTGATGTVQMRGFAIAGYSDDRATIAYYLHTDKREASCTADLVWQNSDWLLKLQPDGSTLSGCSQGVPESFVPWGPT